MRQRKLDLFGGRAIDLSKTNVMGVINIQTDSFWSGSVARSVEDALERAEMMIRDGADIIDIGAESTRPGSRGVDPDVERVSLARAVAAVRSHSSSIPISADTRRAAAAADAIAAGADIINDVSGLLLADEREAMIETIRRTGAAYVLTHTRGTPEDMASLADYDDLWGDMMEFFARTTDELAAEGVDKKRIIIDPGIGFAKTTAHCLDIAANSDRLSGLGMPVLIGASRKTFIGETLGDGERLDPSERAEGTLAVSAICAFHGAEIIRVHDVRENARAIRIASAMRAHRDA